MQIIGRTNTKVINCNSFSFEFFKMPVKSLKFNKESSLREITVDDTNRIKWIVRSYEIVTGFLYCLHMARSNKTCCPDEGKLLNHAGLISRKSTKLTLFASFIQHHQSGNQANSAQPKEYVCGFLAAISTGFNL